MSLCVCKCLNVRLQIAGQPPKSAARIADCEQRDPFFREELVSCPSQDLMVEVAQQALTLVRRDGVWSVHVCVACDTHTHATGPDTHTLLNKTTQTSTEAVEKLRTSLHYSAVFKLLVPEISPEPAPDKSKVSSPAAAALGQQLASSLRWRLEAVEEAVRLYRDQQYDEYEKYREKAHRDHLILASIVNKTRQAERPHEPPSPPRDVRRRLSSFKGVKKLKQNPVRHNRRAGSEEDSLDSEDIFDLEGEEQSRNGNNSDADDYDTDESGSNDEGIHVRGARRAEAVAIARSLPISVPRFSQAIPISHQLDDEEQPQDIAASIKALARSVHSDVFGDLPRPRFSTQI